MKPYGRSCHVKFPNKRDLTPNKKWVNWWEYEWDTISERGALNHSVRKRIDEDIDMHYNGFEDWLEDISKVDPFLCDCSLRPDIDFYIGKQDK